MRGLLNRPQGDPGAGLRHLPPYAGNSSDDFKDGAREVRYALDFLFPDDAFRMFQGILGERRLLSDRNGRRGASYTTLPEPKPLEIQILSSSWRGGDEGERRRYRSAVSGGEAAFAAARAPVLVHHLRCLRNRPRGCRLRGRLPPGRDPRT